MDEAVAEYSGVPEYSAPELVGFVLVENPVAKRIELLGFALLLPVAARGEKHRLWLVLDHLGGDRVDRRLDDVVADPVFQRAGRCRNFGHRETVNSHETG